MRELSLDLKHSGLAPGQCAVGLAVLKHIHECSLEVTDIEHWTEILKLAGSDDKAKAFIDMVYHIQDAREETGLTIDEIDEKFQELQNEAAELQPTLIKVDEKKKEIADLVDHLLGFFGGPLALFCRLNHSYREPSFTPQHFVCNTAESPPAEP